MDQEDFFGGAAPGAGFGQRDIVAEGSPGGVRGAVFVVVADGGTAAGMPEVADIVAAEDDTIPGEEDGEGRPAAAATATAATAAGLAGRVRLPLGRMSRAV